MSIRTIFLIVIIASILTLTVKNVLVLIMDDSQFYDAIADLETLDNYLERDVDSISDSQIVFRDSSILSLEKNNSIRIKDGRTGIQVTTKEFDEVSFKEIDYVVYVKEDQSTVKVEPEKPLFELFLAKGGVKEVFTLCAE